MSGSFTDYAEAKLLDHIFGGVQWPAPTPWVGYVLSAGGENAPGSEPVGAGYNRVIAGPEFWSTSTNQETTNVADIVCPRAAGNQGNVIGITIRDSSNAGNELVYIPIDGSVLIQNRDAIVIPAGVLVHKFLSGGFSNYLKNAILNYVYKGIPLAIDPILYASFMTSAPTDSAAGTEPAEPSYSRIQKNNNLGTFAPTAGGIKATNTDIAFNEAAGSQGTAGWFGWWNNATVGAGNLLSYGPLTPSQAIGAGGQLILRAGEVQITLD